MYKKYLSLLICIACAALASCDASFNVPAPANPNTIPLVNTNTSPFSLTGYVLSSFRRCDDTLPTGAHIIVGWEIASYSQKAFYVYGTGTVDTMSKIPYPYPPEPYGYKLNVTIDSNIPEQVLFPDANATDVIAVGHLFLTTNGYIKNGDTLSMTSFMASDDILGGIELTAVVYVKGNPKLFGKPINQIDFGKSKQGFNFLRTYNGFPDPNKKMTSVFVSNPNSFYLNINDSRNDTEEYNKFWLFQ